MQTVAHYLDLMFYKAYADLRAEATRAYLGFIWWFLEPVMYLVVFYVVFEAGLRRGGVDYVPFLLSGLVAWKWFASTVVASAGVMSRNAGLVQQVYLPKLLLPGVVVISNTAKFIVVLLIFLVFVVLVFHKQPGQAWLALPLVLALQLLLVSAVATLAAALVPLAQDLRLLLDNLITMLFLASGIFFDINEMPPAVADLLMFNPMAAIIDCYRVILLGGAWPASGRLLQVFLTGAVLMAAGALVMVRLDRVYPKLVVK